MTVSCQHDRDDFGQWISGPDYLDVEIPHAAGVAQS
jgi:hypothetical protein